MFVWSVNIRKAARYGLIALVLAVGITLTAVGVRVGRAEPAAAQSSSGRTTSEGVA